MPIEQLDVIPSRYRPTTYTEDMEAFLAWLQRNVPNYNALEQSLQMVATTGTSSSTLTVGTGVRNLAAPAGKAWAVGSWVILAYAGGVSNLMLGQVTAYNSTSGAMTVDVKSATGTGTYSSWVISLGAARGGTETFSGTVSAQRLEAGDALFAALLAAGVPTLQFDEGDALRFNRASNTLELVVGGVVVFSSDQTQSTGLVRKAQLDAAAPPGAVTAFAMSAAPAGWLKANGAAVSRSTYAALFAAIGTTFGAGDGATTFNLPDLRGEFVRGWDDGRSVDGGRVLGSAQAQEIQSHTHTVAIDGGGVNYNGTGTNQVAQRNPAADYPVKAAGGAETRPRNVALLYCIKF